MRISARIIEQVIEAGRERGLSAGDIAVRAGISPPNLSRIRKSGRFNADTLERLLAAIDGDIQVSVRPGKSSRTLPMICKKLNAGRREQLTPDALRRFLMRFRPSARARNAFSHLVGIVEELPLEQVHNLVIEGDAALPALKRIADYVEAEGATADWINEQISTANKLA